MDTVGKDADDVIGIEEGLENSVIYLNIAISDFSEEILEGMGYGSDVLETHGSSGALYRMGDAKYFVDNLLVRGIIFELQEISLKLFELLEELCTILAYVFAEIYFHCSNKLLLFFLGKDLVQVE